MADLWWWWWGADLTTTYTPASDCTNLTNLDCVSLGPRHLSLSAAFISVVPLGIVWYATHPAIFRWTRMLVLPMSIVVGVFMLLTHYTFIAWIVLPTYLELKNMGSSTYVQGELEKEMGQLMTVALTVIAGVWRALSIAVLPALAWDALRMTWWASRQIGRSILNMNNTAGAAAAAPWRPPSSSNHTSRSTHTFNGNLTKPIFMGDVHQFHLHQGEEEEDDKDVYTYTGRVKEL